VALTAVHRDRCPLDATRDDLGCAWACAGIHRVRPRAELTCTECSHPVGEVFVGILQPDPQAVDLLRLQGAIIFVTTTQERNRLAAGAPNGTRIVVLQEPPASSSRAPS
jgi:hypothetical protein